MNDKSQSEKKQKTFNESINKSINAGLAGSTAMCIQVTSLMWLRTTMNYQYRYGSSMKQSFTTLYNDG